MQISIPEFGTLITGQTYILRPGGYGVIRNGSGCIAVVLNPRGAWLPGGGQEPDETPEQALIREVREECGLEIRVSDYIGVADELLSDHEPYWRKRCTFFAAHAVGTCEEYMIEIDHRLNWVSAESAMSQLKHASQRWAVAVEAGLDSSRLT